MSVRKVLWLKILFFSLALSFACADTIYLKNGRSIHGIVTKDEGDEVELAVGSGKVMFRKSEISKMQKSTTEVNSQIRSSWQVQKIETQNRIVNQKRQDEIKPRSVEFSGDNQNIYVKAILNKKVEATFVLDTGASIIMLRREIAEKLGIKLDNAVADMKVQVADGRTVNAKYVVLNSVSVQGIEVNNVPASVLLDETGTMGNLGGLLGMTFLKRFNFKVDYREKKLILEKL